MPKNAHSQDMHPSPDEHAPRHASLRKGLISTFLDREHPACASDAGYRMRILSVLAISFVVLGHINFTGSLDFQLTEPMTLHGWFPYYSFHLPLFLFISGYFFRDLPLNRTFFPALVRFIVRKAGKLLLPYYIFSILSLLFNTWLRTLGFTFGETFSLTDWLLSPWIEPYFVSFATPVWYLPALFIALTMFLLLRIVCRLLFRHSLLRESLLTVITLGAGVAAVYYNASSAASDTAVVYLRSVVMLFFLQTGVLYRQHLEKHDKLKNRWYFLIVFAAQFLLLILASGHSTSPGLYELKNFGETGFVYFLGGLTGLMLWLRVSAIAASLLRKSTLVTFIGKNTMYIMGLHVFSWFLFNTLLSRLFAHNSRMLFVSGFSSHWYHSFLYYCHTTNPRMFLLYYLVGMAIPLLIAWALQMVTRCVRCMLLRLMHRRSSPMPPPEN